MNAKVSLINFTPNAIATMAYARRVMHSAVPDTLQELMDEPERWLGMSLEKYYEEVLLNDGMPTFLEYINLTFKLENVSRALQQQLTRHRIGFSYMIQSLRCVNLPKFAEEEKYFNPFNEEKKEEYHQKMLIIQKIYSDALDQGVPTQDARGLLPMNIFSTITFSCSLRALIEMVNKRLCLKTQGEFRMVAEKITQEVYNKIDPRLEKYFGPPCKIKKYCIMKGENEQQLKENKLIGKQNTEYVCPLYMQLFVKGEKK